MEDAFLNVNTSLAPKTFKDLQWMKGPNSLSYTKKTFEEEVIVKKDALTGLETDLVSLKKVNSRLNSLNISKTLSRMPTIIWLSPNTFSFDLDQKVLMYDLKVDRLNVLADKLILKDAQNTDEEAIQHHTAFTLKNNLYISDGKTIKAITDDKNEGIVNGKSVHRDEFGITKGTFWSPKGNFLAFYRMDESMVTDYPVIDWSTKPATTKNVKYPMAGGKSHEVTVGVYSVSSKKTIFLNTGEPKEQYLTNISWSPDEAHVFIAVLNRDQNHMKLNCYNALTGAFEKTLFEEKDDKYVKLVNPMVFVKHHPEQFIWQSYRDAHNHLYLYHASGKLIKQLTKGNWDVTSLDGFNLDGQKLIFTSTINSPINRDFCSVELKTGKTSRLSKESGTNNATVNEDGTLILNRFSNTGIPLKWEVYNTDGKKLNTLLEAANPLKDYKLGEMQIFSIKNNGDDLYCRLYKPTDFDATKKYPTIVYQYGGPNVQLITNSWKGGTGDLWFQYMAERGYVVFTIDPHGTENRGKKFEQTTFRQLGDIELEDQLAGVAFLKTQAYVDTNRLGLIGWSYGGFMTTSMMTRHPNVFKAAVAGGPVIDWSYYEIMYGERYMDTPEQNPEGYKKSNVINHLDSLKGKLLIIHGAQDAVVVLQHSMMFLKAAVDKGKQVDFYVYPGHEHNVRGKDRVHLFNKITQYFLENL
ncbi:MAG: family peptidase [Sphingobacteriales bacterium]|nr:family peptidase [Sphingobacteriales bacterium]